MTTSATIQTASIQLKGKPRPGFDKVLTPEALEFLADLHDQFNITRLGLLEERKERQEKLNAGEFPSFPKETKIVRQSHWQVAPIPACLNDRRVEITGPVDRKMIINALNSGANVYMADFEDATSPTWDNVIDGQVNLRDAVRQAVDFTSAEGKPYALNKKTAVLKVRPRGLHLDESHILLDGKKASAAISDFALFTFHNAKILAEKEQGPFFYIPKLESYKEARLWNDIFNAAEQMLSLRRGTIKATVLIETITAAFEMEEILYELRDHIDGLNAGRWDYIFSIIKKFHKHEDFVMPDRALVTMDVPFMKAYAQQLVKICHKRGAHAIGGMSAFIPSKDEAVNKAAYEKIKADKEREASQGYDGTWVAHPRLVPIAKAVFDDVLGSKPNQKNVMRDDFQLNPNDLLDIASAGTTITEKGLRTNINVALLYLDSWLNGVGAAALYNLMEDAATAEISRAQLWQWTHHRAKMSDGRTVTPALYNQICDEEFEHIRRSWEAAGHDTLNLSTARLLLDRLVLSPNFDEFLTTKAYLHIQ